MSYLLIYSDPVGTHQAKLKFFYGLRAKEKLDIFVEEGDFRFHSIHKTKVIQRKFPDGQVVNYKEIKDAKDV